MFVGSWPWWSWADTSTNSTARPPFASLWNLRPGSRVLSPVSRPPSSLAPLCAACWPPLSDCDGTGVQTASGRRNGRQSSVQLWLADSCFKACRYESAWAGLGWTLVVSRPFPWVQEAEETRAGTRGRTTMPRSPNNILRKPLRSVGWWVRILARFDRWLGMAFRATLVKGYRVSATGRFASR